MLVNSFIVFIISFVLQSLEPYESHAKNKYGTALIVDIFKYW